jgi:NADH:ubiquinone reductase (H+-translocating)
MAQARVVILGGGFGGLSVAQRLLRKRLGDRIAITVVDRHQESVYTPWLHEVAAGTVHVSALRDVEIDLVSVRGIRYRRATVRGIDHVARHILCDDDSTIPFDILVCAFGSVSNDFGISGIAAFTQDLKRSSDAVQIRERLAELLKRASKNTPQRLLVVGNGANGTEFAAEVASMVRMAERGGVIPDGRVAITLAGMSPEPLAMLPTFLRRRTVRRLEALGVRCEGSLALASVRDGSALLQPMHNGIAVGPSRHEAFDCCVTALGVTMPDVVQSLPFAKNERGRILVDDTLRVLGEPAIFGLGDSVAVNGRSPDPQTAQAAVYQSRTVARNIAAIVMQRALVPYRPKRSWSMLMTLGKGYAVGMLFGVPVWGYTVAILRRVVDANHFFLATSWNDALRRMVRGFLTYAKEGDIKTRA